MNTVSAGTFPLIPLTGEMAKGIPPNSIAVKLVGVATGLIDTTRLNDVEVPQFKILGVTAYVAVVINPVVLVTVPVIGFT